MQNPLSGGRLSWLQRAYILSLYLNNPFNKPSLADESIVWLMLFFVLLPISFLLPCLWYNKRLQHETMFCMIWALLFALVASHLLFTPPGYWFSIFFAHACHYISSYFSKYSNVCPFPHVYQTLLVIFSWKIPFLMAFLQGRVDMQISSLLISSLFIPDILEVACNFFVAMIQAVSFIFEKSWCC